MLPVCCRQQSQRVHNERQKKSIDLAIMLGFAHYDLHERCMLWYLRQFRCMVRCYHVVDGSKEIRIFIIEPVIAPIRHPVALSAVVSGLRGNEKKTASSRVL